MHTVRVGVGVTGRGVIVLVSVGVKLGAVVGAIVRVGDTIVAVSKIKGAAVSGASVGIAVPLTRFTGICPQACIRIARIQITENLLHTIAVYHNTPWLKLRLSLSEYKFVCNQIPPFAGKIAREIYLWRIACVSIS
jgi:hypothetical protein